MFTHSKYELQYLPEAWPVYPKTIFAFLLINIVIKKQLYQQLVKPITRTYSYFVVYKNHNWRAAMPIAGQADHIYTHTYFRFFVCRNCNARAAIPAIGQAN